MDKKKATRPVTPTADEARAALRRLANPAKARLLQGFFKTAPGEYGEGDVFLGVVMPRIHELTAKFRALPLTQLRSLLRGGVHEERMLAVLVAVEQYRKGDEKVRRSIFDFYLAHTRWVNNWDLVDQSAHLIVGPQVFGGNPALLKKLSKSASLWERRIAIIATLHFIRHGRFTETLALAVAYLGDTEDLMHKASGWMLREVGKRDAAVLRAFLTRYGKRMPRTMLRYAIEKFSPAERKNWLTSTKGR
ncbi:MAG: DNA alkylation repair protein [Spirochaetes bacterium]|nr:DNA alkylation repair protein [Spirochaetota bacterium]